MAERKEEERIQSICYLCNGQKLPFGTDLQFLTTEMIHHIGDVHLPLKCDKCTRVFENSDDLKNVIKCCPPMSINGIETNVTIEKENLEVNQQCDQKQKPDKSLKNSDESCQDLTPLSKINMRWRRKSKEFGKVDGSASKEENQRQTSTPMQGNLLTTNHFTDSASYNASSIHISSINCTSSSSESDAFSPPIAAPKPEFVLPISPQRSQKFNRSRAKLSVQATPLRQVMTKSIQRAISQHGHYRQSPFTLQQRKMSFNSTSSSNEATSRSLMKFPGEIEAALDLRLSPALRRFKTITATTVSKELSYQIEADAEPDLINFESHIESHIEFEQIEVIIRRGEIKSDSSAMTSYKSCISEAGRSDSMPDIHFTPKIVGNNMLKKTISFETPNTIGKTPAFLLKKTTKDEDDEDEDVDDDVFYTPRSTPIRTLRSQANAAVSTETNENQEIGPQKDDSKTRNNLWNFMSTVMKIASRTSEDIGESLSNSDKMWKFNFKQPEFVKKATDYFTKRPDDSDDQPNKRRRTSSSNEVRTGSTSSPAMKRQKIQARRPIGRMRNLS